MLTVTPDLLLPVIITTVIHRGAYEGSPYPVWIINTSDFPRRRRDRLNIPVAYRGAQAVLYNFDCAPTFLRARQHNYPGTLQVVWQFFSFLRSLCFFPTYITYFFFLFDSSKLLLFKLQPVGVFTPHKYCGQIFQSKAAELESGLRRFISAPTSKEVLRGFEYISRHDAQLDSGSIQFWYVSGLPRQLG